MIDMDIDIDIDALISWSCAVLRCGWAMDGWMGGGGGQERGTVGSCSDV